MPKPHILIINGPNLNLLGIREPDIYGTKNLDTVARECKKYAEGLGYTIDFLQSNHEGELVTFVQNARSSCNGVIINAGAYAHTSIALLDALKILEMPIIEVHISNTFRRETFRRRSYVSEAAHGVICGLGTHGYILAMNALHELLKAENMPFARAAS